MKKSLFALFLLASAVRADPLFVSILEIDSYESARQSVTSFERKTGLSSYSGNMDAFFAKNIPLPVNHWLMLNKPIRFVTALDTGKPLSDNNPSVLAIVPMIDRGERLLEAASAFYKTRVERGPDAYTLREPATTNRAPEVHLSLDGTLALMTRSRETLDWGWKVRDRFIKAPLDMLPGTFRFLVNAQRFAGLLPLFSPEIARYDICTEILKNFPTALVTLDVRSQGIGLAVRGIPVDTSKLAANARLWLAPPSKLLARIPHTPLFACASNSQPPSFTKNYIPEPYAGLFEPLLPLLPESVLKGPAMSVLTETSDGKGLCFLSCANVAEGTDLAETAAKLPRADGALKWTALPSRQALDTTVYRFKAELAKQNKPQENSPTDALLQMVLKLFLQKTVMETFVKDGELIVMLGPDRPLAEEGWEKILHPLPSVQTLDKELSFDSWFDSGILVQGTRLHPSAFLLKSFSIIPGIRREQLLSLPPPGEPGLFGVAKAEDGTITIGLRLPTSEVASLRKFDDEARPMLQEIFFQLLAQQMEAREKKDGTAK
ncbi:MAG: hypothetical protein J6Z49_04640 [Kiritimatiellae bacterium]|nr:hypothetical protein [Kiritimatiellia bacterium]